MLSVFVDFKGCCKLPLALANGKEAQKNWALAHNYWTKVLVKEDRIPLAKANGNRQFCISEPSLISILFQIDTHLKSSITSIYK